MKVIAFTQSCAPIRDLVNATEQSRDYLDNRF